MKVDLYVFLIVFIISIIIIAGWYYAERIKNYLLSRSTFGSSRKKEAIQGQTIIEDFDIYGFKSASTSSGSEANYENELDKLKTGQLIKAGDMKVITDVQKENIQKKINELELKNTQLNSEINAINEPNNGKIAIIDREIKILGQQIIDIKKTGAAAVDDHYKMFSKPKFAILLIGFVVGFLFLFWYYTGIFYLAFGSIPPQLLIEDGKFGVPIIFPWNELINNPRFMVSIFFLLLFNIAWNFADKTKSIVIAVALFLADVFFSIKAYNKSYEMAELIFETPAEVSKNVAAHFWLDSNTYIIIIFGFLTIMIWCYILKEIMAEWRKRGIITILQEEIDKLTAEKNTLHGVISDKKIEIDNLAKQIEHLNTEKESVVVNPDIIEHNINQFTTGYIRYISNLYLNNSAKREECIERINSIKSQYLLSNQ